MWCFALGKLPVRGKVHKFLEWEKGGQSPEGVKIVKMRVLCLVLSFLIKKKSGNVNLIAFSRRTLAGGWFSWDWCLKEIGMTVRQMWFEYFPERIRLSHRKKFKVERQKFCILIQVLPLTCYLGFHFMEEKGRIRKVV